MALLVGNPRGTRRDAAVPDAARCRARLAVLEAVADAVRAAPQPCVDRRGDRRGVAGLCRHNLPARRADRADVQADRDQPDLRFAQRRMVRLDAGGRGVRRRGRAAARARQAGFDLAAAGDDGAGGAGAGAGGRIGAVPALARGDGAAEIVGFRLFDRGGDDGGGGVRGAARQCGDRQWQRRPCDEPGAALGGAGAGGRGAAAGGDCLLFDAFAGDPIWLDSRAHLGGDRGGHRAGLWHCGRVGGREGAARFRRLVAAIAAEARDRAGAARFVPCAADPRFRDDFDARSAGAAEIGGRAGREIRLGGDGVRFRAERTRGAAGYCEVGRQDEGGPRELGTEGAGPLDAPPRRRADDSARCRLWRAQDRRESACSAREPGAAGRTLCVAGPAELLPHGALHCAMGRRQPCRGRFA